LLIDEDVPDFPLKDFIKKIRSLGITTRAKNPIPCLILSQNLEKVHAELKDISGIKYLQKPTTAPELVQALLSLEGHSKFTPEQIKPVTKGEFIIEEGSPSDEMYWVISGKFNIVKRDNGGQSIV